MASINFIARTTGILNYTVVLTPLTGGSSISGTGVAVESGSTRQYATPFNTIPEGFYQADIFEGGEWRGNDAVQVTGAGTGTYWISAYIANQTNVAGPGSRQLVWTSEVSGTPVAGVKCWVSIDSPYTQDGTRAGTSITDDDGEVTFGLDDNVVYYGWRDHPSVNFPNPIRFQYSTADSQWQIWNGSAYVEWT
ncbi:hypothetical protein [Planctomicrobium piriforme]|uniref:Uncharacterized protein n=1 Tax=Planctomicrobium piriforme TaxID=1576369 RepID=A0A1I3ECB1_9PLAN|nr:hypothetical protein [Planctomicrobium piriforme]SFH96604.1 hypothetical protein SAMN05421753_104162 [Planctomicrobium piriforme]